MKVITMAHFKGGVGKSTLAAGLAMAARADRMPVTVVDASPQSSLHERWMQSEQRNERWPFEVAPNASTSVGEWIKRRWGDEQGPRLIVVDTPPELPNIMTEAAKVADLVIVPSSASGMDLRQLPNTKVILRDVHAPTWVVLTMVLRGTKSAVVARSRVEAMGMQLCPVQVPRRENVASWVAGPPPLTVACQVLWEWARKELGD